MFSFLTVMGALWFGTGGAEKIKDGLSKPKSSEWAVRQRWGDLINTPEGQLALKRAQYWDKYHKPMPDPEPTEINGNKIIYWSKNKKGFVTVEVVDSLRKYIAYCKNDKGIIYPLFSSSYCSNDEDKRNALKDAKKYADEC